MSSRFGAVTLASVVLVGAGPSLAAQTPAPETQFEPLLRQLDTMTRTGDVDQFLALLAPGAEREAATEFAIENLRSGTTRSVVKARTWTPLDDKPGGDGYRTMIEVFLEMGTTARLATWELDLVRDSGASEWRIAAHEAIDSIEGLYNLGLHPGKQYAARNLVIAGEDMTLKMSDGSVFVAEIDEGVTGLVLIGSGVMTFSPAPDAEKGQVRILAGSETLVGEFTEAFVRLHPDVFMRRVSTAALVPRSVSTSDLRRAEAVFNEFITETFTLDVSDLSTKTWSLLPSVSDFVAEVRTRRYGTLTYAQTGNQPEDVTLYERAASRVISLYPSARKRAVQGRYFSDDDAVPYDIVDYHIVASFEPTGVSRESLRAEPRLTGCRIEGTTRLAVRVTALNLAALTLRLADALDVSSVTSREFGPLLFLRVRGQNNIIINLPSPVPIDTEFTLLISYAGVLEAQELDENWIGVQRIGFEGDVLFGMGTPRYVYSSSSYWYPQATASDYATATMELTVPTEYGVVASGDPGAGGPVTGPRSLARHTYTFVTLQPARYLSCVISHFASPDMASREVTRDPAAPRLPDLGRPGVYYDSLSLSVASTERSRDKVPTFYQQAGDILRFYTSLIGDMPYPTFTLALTDSRLPGGHSPAYFAVLNQPLPTHAGPIVSWRTDPVSFDAYPSFFLAHELAHQWWGQAVGWKNYHEQWLSEGLSQYFATLYAQREGGHAVFADVLSQMRRWSERHTREGPIYLGYRLGHIEEEPRIFRALVYNKAAMVLHMLRRLIGDEAFFGGLRRFYAEMRFSKAGTDDLIRAFEIEAKRSLEVFFERWIHEIDLPRLKFSSRTEARIAGQRGETDVLLRFEQGQKIFEVPVTVTLIYRSGESENIIVPVTEQVTELRHPLKGQLRNLEVNQDNAALVEINR
jgi:hypothetical protein